MLEAIGEVALMRILYVVQRYGEQIAGGAEQHARAFAERLVERDHQVTVLTTCAQSYVDWANVYPRGWSTLERRGGVPRAGRAARATRTSSAVSTRA